MPFLVSPMSQLFNVHLFSVDCRGCIYTYQVMVKVFLFDPRRFLIYYRALRCFFLQWDKTLTSITLIRWHLSVEMPTLIAALYWERPSVGEFLSTMPLDVKDLRAELIMNYLLGLVFWSADTAAVALPLYLLHNAFYVVCLLSYSMCVNQKPQWVEGRKEMDTDVMWLRISLLCVLACIIPVQFSALFFSFFNLI